METNHGENRVDNYCATINGNSYEKIFKQCVHEKINSSCKARNFLFSTQLKIFGLNINLFMKYIHQQLDLHNKVGNSWK